VSLRRKQNGQGLTEFALILPLLLLLLLGIIEGARIIWAYINVQSAAREAARYAITGKPYIDGADISSPTAVAACQTAAGEPNASEPWLCDPDLRVEAIKEIAIERGLNLSVSEICRTPLTFQDTSLCAQLPGAFGVQVTGQAIVPTMSITIPMAIVDHPGTQGLNVRVETFYNVQMLDPIYDLLMGGNYIQLRGEVEMQNEGIDASLNDDPPPAIDQSPFVGSSNPPGTGPNGETIEAINGYIKDQGDDLQVKLTNHSPTNSFGDLVYYDIYLESAANGRFKICSHVTTDIHGNGEEFCPIPFIVPPGDYELYSTLENELGRVAPGAPSLVTVKENNRPTLALEEPGTDHEINTWAANSWVEVVLRAHKPAEEPFDVGLYDQPDSSGSQLQGIANNEPAQDVGASTNTILWRVPDQSGACSASDSCAVQSRKAGQTQTYAADNVIITQPEIALAGNQMKYAQGEIMRIFLRDHTPGLPYRVKITSMTNGTVYYDQISAATDSGGDTTDSPLVIPIPEVNGWPNDFYKITTHQLSDPSSLAIATLENVQIDTPAGPYVTVDNGYVWPIGSFINIRVHKHEPNALHHLDFGPWRVPTTAADNSNTFQTAADGTAVVPYQIPLTATESTSKFFEIASYIDETAGGYNDGDQIATRDIEVFPEPLIMVLQGNTVSPDTQITIRLTNHSPNTSYAIYYFDTFLFNILTDSTGSGEKVYDLTKLPFSGPPPGCNICYGTSYELFSQQTIGAQAKVASTNLKILPADLELTAVEFPANVQINTTIPVTFTITNLEVMTISRPFDVDFYLDPSPLVPMYRAGQFNAPGDIKEWRTQMVPPLGQFTMNGTFFVGEYGDHDVYGYADTSDFVFGEFSESNNVNSNMFTVNCAVQFTTEKFGSVPGTWSATEFGDGSSANNYPTVTNGHLELRSRGSSTVTSDDDGSGAGLFYFHKTDPVSTTAGLDVRVQVFAAPTNQQYASAGLQLRNSLDSRSAKIEFNLAYQNGSNFLLLPLARGFNQNATDLGGSALVSLGAGDPPVWLRIRRVPNSDTFEFYYLPKAGTPTEAEWDALSPYATANLGAMDDELLVGVLNASYKNNFGNSEFDNFMISSSDNCPPAQGQPTDDFTPPGLKICESPLVNAGFENASDFRWVTDPKTFSAAGSGGFGASNRGLNASTYYTSYNIPGPYFYQMFMMPTWVISGNTSFELGISKSVDDLGTPDPNDSYTVAIYDGIPTSVGSTLVATAPTTIARGDDGKNWVRIENYKLNTAPGINLEDYAEQNLYISFFNKSNTNCSPFDGAGGLAGCRDTTYLFDDITLDVCTEQPGPDVVNTQIQGDLTLTFLNGTSQKIPGVKVWAYAEGGELYETFTIQDGQFNFFNLPAAPGGTKYFIYAEYNIVNPNDPSVVETLTDNTTVILKPNNDSTNPVTTRLKLQTLF
jgi:hypothetical protein